LEGIESKEKVKANRINAKEEVEHIRSLSFELYVWIMSSGLGYANMRIVVAKCS